MTDEVKAEGRRKSSHQRSKSSIGEYTSSMDLDVIKDVRIKESPKASKVTGKDHSRSWFLKSRKSTNPETYDLEVDLEKPLQQRVVQGLYRDDDGGPSPKILNTCHAATRDAVKKFARDFVAQLKAGDGDASQGIEYQMRQHLHLTAGSPPPPTDWKFLTQAYIAHHLFSDFENASFRIPNPGEKPWEVQDHMRRCFAQFQTYKVKFQTVSMLLENNKANAESFLSQFCMRKFRTVVPLDSGGAFFGGHHLELEKGRHPDTPFYKSFLSAAVSVWLLQRLAFSFEQKTVTIFPTGGDAFQRRFMTPVVPGIGDTEEEEENDKGLKIAFAVFPGFRVSESIVESLVYVVESPPSLPKVDGLTSSTVVEPSVETTTSGNRDETSSVTRKSSKGWEYDLLQKIRSKFIRKKTLVKGTVVAEIPETIPATVTAPPPLEEPVPSKEEEAPLEEPSHDVEENTTSVTNPASVPRELSSPTIHPLNVEEVTDSYMPPLNYPSNPYSLGLDDGDRLYTPRAGKSPRLSSVD